MNDGILAWIVYVIMVTLLSTGWWVRLRQQMSISPRLFLIILTVGILLNQIYISVWDHFTLHVGLCFALWVTVVCWRKTTDPFLMVSAIVLAGSFCYFVREMTMMDPALMLVPDEWLQTITLLLLAFTTLSTPWQRMTMLCGGICLGYGLSLLRHFSQLTERSFGNESLSDLLWVSLFIFFCFQSVPWSLKKRGNLLSSK